MYIILYYNIYIMDKTLKGKCMKCKNEYDYSPLDEKSIVKSRWIRSARVCSMDCFKKLPDKIQDMLPTYEYIRKHIEDNHRQKKDKKNNKMYL